MYSSRYNTPFNVSCLPLKNTKSMLVNNIILGMLLHLIQANYCSVIDDTSYKTFFFYFVFDSGKEQTFALYLVELLMISQRVNLSLPKSIPFKFWSKSLQSSWFMYCMKSPYGILMSIIIKSLKVLLILGLFRYAVVVIQPTYYFQ